MVERYITCPHFSGPSDYWPGTVRNELLLRFEVTVDNANTMQMVQSQCQLSEVEFHILLRKHHLELGAGQRLIFTQQSLTLTSFESLVKRSPPRRNSSTR